jgi:ABC-type lipoprotein export system ATPase subunit
VIDSTDDDDIFVKTRGLVREYRVGPSTVRALDGLDLDVRRCEFLAVLGVSGSGKSTLLHLLGGLDTPSSGSVVVGGRDLASLSAYERTLYRRTTVGLVFQSYYLVPSLTAEENVALALTFQGTFGEERRRRAVYTGLYGEFRINFTSARWDEAISTGEHLLEQVPCLADRMTQEVELFIGHARMNRDKAVAKTGNKK